MSWEVFNLEEDEELAHLSPTAKARILLSVTEPLPSKDDIADLGPSPLYFAYGRNLNPARMIERNVNFTRRRAAEARDWKLTFFKAGGYATMVPCPGSTVHGVLYDVDPSGIVELDGHEGVASMHYSRERIRVRCADEDLEVVVYLATREMTRNGIKPSAMYLEDLLCEGSRELLPSDYHAWLAKSPTRESFEECLCACSPKDGLVRVFTYGTLMRGFHNHKHLGDAVFMGCATTCEAYTMLSERFPYVDASIYPPAGCIHGEVYVVDSEQLSDLDALEGHPHWYHREPVEVEFDCAPVELELEPLVGETAVTRVLDLEDELDKWLWRRQCPNSQATTVVGSEEAPEVTVDSQNPGAAPLRKMVDVGPDLDKWLRQKKALSREAPAAEKEEAPPELEMDKPKIRVWAFIYFNEMGSGEVVQSGRFADRSH